MGLGIAGTKTEGQVQDFALRRLQEDGAGESPGPLLRDVPRYLRRLAPVRGEAQPSSSTIMK